MAKKNYYVVWFGREPGIYNSWEECMQQTNKFSGEEHEGFCTMKIAEKAFKMGYPAYEERKDELKAQDNDEEDFSALW